MAAEGFARLHVVARGLLLLLLLLGSGACVLCLLGV